MKQKPKIMRFLFRLLFPNYNDFDNLENFIKMSNNTFIKDLNNIILQITQS